MNSQARRQAARHLLGHREVDLHLREGLEADDRRPDRHELPDIDVRDADDAVKGRLDGLLIRGRLQAREIRARNVERILRGLDGGRRRESGLTEFGRPRELTCVETDIGTRRDHARLLDRIVDLHQELPGRHLLVGREIDRLDVAGDLHRNVRTLNGARRADGIDDRRPGAARDRARGNRHRRTLKRLRPAGEDEHQDRPEKIPGDECGAQDPDADGNNSKSFRHDPDFNCNELPRLSRPVDRAPAKLYRLDGLINPAAVRSWAYRSTAFVKKGSAGTSPQKFACRDPRCGGSGRQRDGRQSRHLGSGRRPGGHQQRRASL